MISSHALLADLRRLLKILEDDLRERISASATLNSSLNSEWQAARDAKRSGETYETWLEEVVTQAAVHWLLACVFLRFIEDNGLVDRPLLSGPGYRLALAQDRHESYFRANPHESDREYLVACFREVEQLPGMAALFDKRHNPVFRIGISGDAAMALLAFWQKIDPDTGQLIHDFADSTWSTRFLGNLYQELSEPARKRYALLQTPVFIEEFILDRTLTPALAEFGYRVVRLIDPTCGSGHFLLGAFQRLLDLWARNEPARNVRYTVQKALDGVYGVDLNPFAVAIARFRLLVAALHACDVRQLKDAPAFKVHVAVGDSLLHGRRFRELDLGSEHQAAERHGYAHAYAIEDLDEVNRILGQQHHVVVGNPPYITVKDAVLNQAYRARYSSCHMKYSLGVPFTQRFFELAVSGDGRHPAGYVGMITTNSFMKREFGSKLIETYLPTVDLTHVIDTSGAYIPGHGTPTVILFGRDRRPTAKTVRTVMGIKGEPAKPDDPAQGMVWRAIVTQVDSTGSESAFVSVADTPRATFAAHPWSIGGGGAAYLKEEISNDRKTLISITEAPGIGAVTSEDEAFISDQKVFTRARIKVEELRGFVEGDEIRDWTHVAGASAVFPYAAPHYAASASNRVLSYLWSFRTGLRNRVWFRKTQEARGLAWFEYGFLSMEKTVATSLIAYGEIATHNHFVLDRAGKVFNRTAPVIGLPAKENEDDYLGLLALLNSSTACFWLKQVCFPKGGDHVGQQGARVRKTLWDERYAFNATNVALFPLPESPPVGLGRELDRLGCLLSEKLPTAVVKGAVPTVAALHAAREEAKQIRARMVALQEELDWRCYRLYGLLDQDLETTSPPSISPGERAFEIVLAQRMANGTEGTTWFARHGLTPITDIPPRWPEKYRKLVERRIALIRSDRNIGLIERPEYKRRWAIEPWEEQERRALRVWLLNRLEDARYWAGDPALKSVNRLTDIARADAEFLQVAELYAGHEDFDVVALVGELVGSEAVPFLPVLRYSESGLRKREQWERTWVLQRNEDAIDALVERELKRRDDEGAEQFKARLAAEQKKRKQAEVGDIPVPPKYQSKDFLKSDYWRLRGALDVPKERWVSYPGCERGADGSLVVAWAGWDHLQQATALAAYYLDMKDNEGWEPARLQPLLAGLLELVPWLKQWHNEYVAAHSARMGDYFEAFVVDEARGLGLTADELRAWKPTSSTMGRRRRRTAG